MTSLIINILIACVSIFQLGNCRTRVCNSWLECWFANINADAAECTARRSCQSATINSPNVTCDGVKACAYADLTGVEFGNCDAKKACRYADIVVTGELDCSANKACEWGAIEVEEGASLSCSARYSCSRTASGWGASNLKLYGSIECSGGYSCWESDIRVKSPDASVLCNGYKSCYSATIKLSSNLGTPFEISGEAEYAFLETEIYSRKNNTLTVSLDGYGAGWYMYTYCGEDSTCTVVCEGEACNPNTTLIYCHPSATCYTDGSDCTNNIGCAGIEVWTDSTNTTKAAESLNIKNETNVSTWLNSNMILGVILSSFILFGLYYCYNKGKKINNFEEYQPLINN